MTTQSPVFKLYMSVVDDVITNVHEAFLDENVDEVVLQDLRQLWENKLQQSKAVEGVGKKSATDPQHLMALPDQHRQILLAQQAQAQVQAQPPVQLQPQQLIQQGTQAATTEPQIQMPIFSPGQGTYEMSGAAQAAAVALPNALYQQQLAAAIQTGNVMPGAVSAGTTQHAQYIVQTPQGQQLIQVPLAQAAGSQVSLAAANLPIVPKTEDGQAVSQVDGTGDTSSSEDDDDDDDDKDDANGDQNDEDDAGEEEESPLNSDDDISESDPQELFDTDNVVVCQFDKINRNKNRWRFTLKDGIMNLNGRDLVFQRASGDAEW